MKQVAIIGLGLIGTSLGLALKQLKAPPRVVGNDIQYDAVQVAKRLKAIDRSERDPAVAVQGADLVVLATPVGAFSEVLERVVHALPKGSIVTDTGSTKREVVRQAEAILPEGVSFVGGHPMTGKATIGVDQPDASLFRSKVYCLTPSPATPPDAIAAVAEVVKEIGARAYFLDPAEHDGLVAGISHLPYLVAVSLMRCMASESGWREMSSLAAGGFDTATRLSAHSPRMYADILATNGDNVVRHLDRLIEELERARARLVSGDRALAADLEEAHRYRVEWEIQKRREAQENE